MVWMVLKRMLTVAMQQQTDDFVRRAHAAELQALQLRGVGAPPDRGDLAHVPQLDWQELARLALQFHIEFDDAPAYIIVYDLPAEGVARLLLDEAQACHDLPHQAHELAKSERRRACKS